MEALLRANVGRAVMHNYIFHTLVAVAPVSVRVCVCDDVLLLPLTCKPKFVTSVSGTFTRQACSLSRGHPVGNLRRRG